MAVPKDLKYTKSHEWVRLEGNSAEIGITDYAQETLGDIVYVENPEVGSEFAQEDEVGNIESVKAAAPIYSPLSGTIEAVNDALEDSPESINEEPYGTFLFKLTLSNPDEYQNLLSAEEYEQFMKEEE
jgi:glycine cleavage system H protein